MNEVDVIMPLLISKRYSFILTFLLYFDLMLVMGSWSKELALFLRPLLESNFNTSHELLLSEQLPAWGLQVVAWIITCK